MGRPMHQMTNSATGSQREEALTTAHATGANVILHVSAPSLQQKLRFSLEGPQTAGGPSAVAHVLVTVARGSFQRRRVCAE